MVAAGGGDGWRELAMRHPGTTGAAATRRAARLTGRGRRRRRAAILTAGPSPRCCATSAPTYVSDLVMLMRQDAGGKKCTSQRAYGIILPPNAFEDDIKAAKAVSHLLEVAQSRGPRGLLLDLGIPPPRRKILELLQRARRHRRQFKYK
eukprot:352887-Chlamydomonas_euryale.AAC.8